MARRIIIMEKISSGSDVNHYRYALWATVPTARRSFYADATKTSQVTGTAAPTNAELNDLRNGVIVERVSDSQWPVSMTLAEIQNDLITAWNLFQTEINNYNPWIRYGTSWDDTGGGTWTARTVA